MTTEAQKEASRARYRAWYQANKERAKARSVAWARANPDRVKQHAARSLAKSVPDTQTLSQYFAGRIATAEVAKAVILLLEAKFDLYDEDF